MPQRGVRDIGDVLEPDQVGRQQADHVGEGVVERIVAARRDGPFTDFPDFCERVELDVLNKRTIESMIKAGAFDSLGYARKALSFRFEEIVDAIVAAEVLEHIEPLDDTLRLFESLLRPTGRLVVSLPTENRLYRLGRRLAGFHGHYYESNAASIHQQILAAGFRQTRPPGPAGTPGPPGPLSTSAGTFSTSNTTWPWHTGARHSTKNP